MFKFVTRIFLVLLFITTFATYVIAQEEQPDTATATIAPPDSVEMTLDSITGQLSDSTYTSGEYEDEEGETLYFLGKEDSASLYDSSVLEWRKVPDTTLQALHTDADFWYANMDRTQKKKTKKEDDTNSNGFLEFLADVLGSAVVRQAIFIFIILLFAAAVIWFLVKNEMNLFGRSRRKITVDQPGEGEPENIFTVDLQAIIQNAVSKEDYRLAIRLSYLQLLKKLSEEGWIKYKEDTTNMEYMMQLYNQPFYKEFFTVTRSYEYVWYGEMPVDKPLYERLQQDFAILYTKASLSN